LYLVASAQVSVRTTPKHRTSRALIFQGGSELARGFDIILLIRSVIPSRAVLIPITKGVLYVNKDNNQPSNKHFSCVFNCNTVQENKKATISLIGARVFRRSVYLSSISILHASALPRTHRGHGWSCTRYCTRVPLGYSLGYLAMWPSISSRCHRR
jgi:hypothetical protein